MGGEERPFIFPLESTSCIIAVSQESEEKVLKLEGKDMFGNGSFCISKITGN